MHHFLITYAPFIVLFASIAVAFWAASQDKAVKKD